MATQNSLPDTWSSCATPEISVSGISPFLLPSTDFFPLLNTVIQREMNRTAKCMWDRWRGLGRSPLLNPKLCECGVCALQAYSSCRDTESLPVSLSLHPLLLLISSVLGPLSLSPPHHLCDPPPLSRMVIGVKVYKGPAHPNGPCMSLIKHSLPIGAPPSPHPAFSVFSFLSRPSAGWATTLEFLQALSQCHPAQV